MSRPVADSQVRAIKPSAVIDCYDPYILAANAVVSALDCDLTDAVLEQVEIFFAAHLASAVDAPIKRQKFENAEKEFAFGELGSGVMSTPFGQTANALSGGCLENSYKQEAKVEFF